MKLTLQQYRESKFEELFFAVLTREVSWEEVKNIRFYPLDCPEGISATDVLEKTSDHPAKFSEIEAWEITFVTVLLKHGDFYIEIPTNAQLPPEYEIKCLIPFKRYCNKEEYSFEQDKKGKPYLKLEGEDPFEKFIKDYDEGKFD